MRGFAASTEHSSRREWAVLCAVALIALLQHSSRAQRFGFGFGGGPDLEVAKQFDKDGNGRLSGSRRAGGSPATTTSASACGASAAARVPRRPAGT